MKKTAASAKTTSKHAGTSKHSGTAKHAPLDAHQKHLEHLHLLHEEHLAHEAHIHAVATPPAHAKPRTLSMGDVGCCSAEALAASLRLAGMPVSDEDVLGLYWHTASNPDTGASIETTLEAAWRFGLGGVRPVFEELTGVGAWRRLVLKPQSQLKPLRPCPATAWDWLDFARTFRDLPRYRAATSRQPAGMILGVELPGSHAVLATPEGWWSWGELHDPADFPDAAIEEAWAVIWP